MMASAKNNKGTLNLFQDLRQTLKGYFVICCGNGEKMVTALEGDVNLHYHAFIK